MHIAGAEPFPTMFVDSTVEGEVRGMHEMRLQCFMYVWLTEVDRGLSESAEEKQKVVGL